MPRINESKCFFCEKTAELKDLIFCSNCVVPHYCSQDCRDKHLIKGHYDECVKFVEYNTKVSHLDEDYQEEEYQESEENVVRCKF